MTGRIAMTTFLCFGALSVLVMAYGASTAAKKRRGALRNARSRRGDSGAPYLMRLHIFVNRL